MHRNSVVFLTFLILSLVATSTVQAKPNKPVPSAKTPVIEGARVTFEDDLSCGDETVDTVTIRGSGFSASDGSEPTAVLGLDALLTVLIVCTSEEDLIVAKHPSGFEAGDYLLSVIVADTLGTFNLTIGAVGPIGPAGADGTNGIDGAPGANGQDGNDGAPGQDGVDGADGIQGPEGAEGPQGPEGPQGSQGEQGIQGEQGPVGEQGIQGAQGPEGAQGPAGVSTSGTIQSGVCESVGVPGGNNRFCSVSFPTSFSTIPVCVATSNNGIWSASIIPSETTIYYVSILFYRNPEDSAFENVKASWICHSN